MKTTELPEGLVEETLKSLGIEVAQLPGGGELVCRCPDHRDRDGKLRADHKPSWSINAQSGLHQCFSCGFRGNLYTLVRDLSGQDEANRFWSDKTPPDMPVPEGYQVDRDMAMPNRNNRSEDAGRRFPESALALFTDPPQWALDMRRIAGWAAELHGVRWVPETASWVLPLRDPDTDDLMGWQIKGQRDRIFLNRPSGIKKSETLFGYRAVKGHDRIVVVESPLDAVLLLGLGHPAVALCGSHMSHRQMEILCRFPFFVLALDNDDAGRTETRRVLDLPAGATPKFGWVTYRDGDPKDVGEMDYGDIEAVLSRAGL